MPVDIFATKGTEYLLVIVYFAVLIAVARYIAPRERRPAGAAAPRAPWFSLADGYFFHPGHSWAADSGEEQVKVGLDDFAAQLVGVPDRLELPRVGSWLRQGESAWSVRVGDRALGMVSPVEGEVVEVNSAVQQTPRLAAEDPYGEGWLLKVRPADRAVSLRNLLSGGLASAWMRHTAERLRGLPLGGLGVVMTDGGEPMPGFGRSLAPEDWDALTREFFRTG